MVHKNWYAHVCEQTLGPLSESTLVALVRHGRIQTSDFVWAEGMAKWQRLSEIETFAKLLPGYPKVDPPGASATTASKKAPKLEADESGRVPIFGTVMFDNDDHHQVINIGETGILIKPGKELAQIGKEAHFRLASLVFDLPLEMTGILVPESDKVVIEFTKLNPMHRRQIKSYVESVISKK
jgi:GYF domain 2